MRDDSRGVKRETSNVKRKPLGTAIIWSRATLDAMARITERDVARAKRVWRRLAPPKYRNLLDARGEPEGKEENDGENTVVALLGEWLWRDA